MQTLPPVTLTGVQQIVKVADFLPGPAVLRIANESSYALQLQIGSGTFWLNPFMADIFHPGQGITSFTVTPSLLTAALPLSEGALLVTLAEPGEKFPGTYPVDLSRQQTSLTPQTLLGLAVSNTQNQVTTQTYPLPGGTHSVALMAQNSVLLTGLTVTGAASGKKYIDISTTTDANFPTFAPVVSAVDTAVTLKVTQGAGGGIVYGAAEPDFGTSPPDISKIVDHETAQGRRLSIIHWFEAWKATGYPSGDFLGFRADVADAIIAHGSVPLLTMEPWDVNNGAVDTFPLTQIAAGAFDQLITNNWALPVKAWGKRVLIRPFGEMNGSWVPWGYQSTASGGANTAAQIVAAWKHVVDLFVALGVTNVEWVWCPNAGPTAPNLSVFYPGDAYVDWLGCDVYNFNTPWLTFTAAFTTAYGQITAVNATKPIIIAEFGSVEGAAGQKATWLSNVGGEMSGTFPRITAAVYFDIEVGGNPGVPLASTPGALAAAKAAFPLTPYNVTPYRTNAWLSAVLDPLAVVAIAGAPAPWQAPNQVPLKIEVNPAAAAVANLIPASPGQSIYLHNLNFFHVTATPNSFGYFEDTAGIPVATWNQQVVGPYSMNLNGVKLPVGRGFQIHNNSAVNAAFLNGSVSYSLG